MDAWKTRGREREKNLILMEPPMVMTFSLFCWRSFGGEGKCRLSQGHGWR